MRERARPTEWTREASANRRGAITPAPAVDPGQPAPPETASPQPAATVVSAPVAAQTAREYPAETDRRNPTYGVDYWMLGLAAAIPAFICAVVFLAAAGVMPFVPPLPVGLAVGAVLVLLGVGAVFAHANDYPAWTLPGLGLLPLLTLLLPMAILRGQVLTRVDGDPDRMVAAPLAVIWFLLAAATIVCATAAIVAGRFAPSFSGMALLPAPLILSWLILLAPPFEERRVIIALGCALALASLTTFLGWLVPTAWRPAAPAVALGLQFILLVALGIDVPSYSGAVRPMIVLDIVLMLVLVALVLFVPFCAMWLRQRGWFAVERLLG